MTKKVSITQISATFSQSGAMLFGLGSDNRVYLWTAKDGGKWMPNWMPPAPAMEADTAPTAADPVIKKRLITAAGKKKGGRK